MTLRTILTIPDPRLKKVCAPVIVFDETLRILSDDLLETMYAAPGIGLAASQIGVLQRVLVMDCDKQSESPNPRVLVNPEITWYSSEKRVYEEGCLSIPETFAEVSRSEKVKVSYKGLTGEDNEEIFTDLWSTCVQHEIDHLDGKLFIDYLGVVKRGLIVNKMKKLKREKIKDQKQNKKTKGSP